MDIDAWIVEFVANPWIGALSFVAAIASIFLAIFFYIKSNQGIGPVYAIRNANLIKDLDSRLKPLVMLYNQKSISTLSVARIAFWNNGRKTISITDIATTEPLKVRCLDADAEILDASIIQVKNSANQFALVELAAGKEYSVNFEYLDKNEGIVIQVIHTGDRRDAISLEGTFKGAQLKRIDFSASRLISLLERLTRPMSKRVARNIIGLSLLTAPLVVMIFPPPDSSNGFSREGYLLALSVPTLSYWWLSYLVLTRRAPRGLDTFDEEI